MKLIRKGENHLFYRDLKKVDGTPLLIADTTSITVDIYQNGTVIQSLSYPSSALRAGDTPSRVVLEISTTISDLFSRGKVNALWTIVATNGLFAIGGSQKSIRDEVILDVK